MKCFLGVILTVLVGTAGVLADCTTPVRVVTKTTKPVLVEAVLAPVAVLAVTVPSYGPTWQPSQALPVGPPAVTPPPAGQDQVLKLLQQLTERLDRLEKGSTLPPPPSPSATTPGTSATPTLPAAPAVLGAKCAQCHQQGNESKGGGFVLLGPGGAAGKLDDVAKWKVFRNAYKGVMPPPKAKSGVDPLTDEEVAALFQYLDTLR